MKIVITALGSGGDVFPFIAIGQALRQPGYAVPVLANLHFANSFGHAGGLSLLPLGT